MEMMEKISKAQVKFVRSLQLKKVRDAEGLFVAEGEKCVEELRRGFELVYYIQTAEKPLPNLPPKGQEVATLIATPTEIEQMSSLKTPQGVIGVFKKNGGLMNGDAAKPLNGGMMQGDLILVLDGVQDPGNLGTIIRTCDWFGVHEIVCSKDTADCYNPKVVQATMGALARVKVRYVDLVEWLITNERLNELTNERMMPKKVRIYGTLLEGENMYEVLGNGGLINGDASLNGGLMPQVIIMGNEGNGISAEVRKLITHPIRIPSYPKDGETSESLNVSIATAIVLAEFRRENK
jgi:TrmH family RNA methyltransferase